jgi:hypothetical protein
MHITALASKEVNEREVLVRSKRCLKQALTLVEESEALFRRAGGNHETFRQLRLGRELLTGLIRTLDAQLESILQ